MRVYSSHPFKKQNKPNKRNKKMIVEVKEILTKYTQDEDIDKKAKRNQHPDSISYTYLKKDKAGNWITGYTPGFYKEEEKELIEQEREMLAKSAGIKFDVTDPDDPFLSLYKIDRAHQGNKMPILDTEDPGDLFKIRAAIANGVIADKKENVGTGTFKNTTFYFHSRELNDNKEKKTAKLRIQIGAILNTNESERAWLVSQCFSHGMIVKPSYEDDTLYTYLAKVLEECKTISELQELETSFKRKSGEINRAFVAKQMIDTKVVYFDQINQTYMFQEEGTDVATEVGKSIVEAESMLANPNNSLIYAQISKKVYDKYKIS